MTDVMNLATGEVRTYDLDPRAAVIAAYAQGLGDFNTWDYGKRYANIHVVETPTIYNLGDWASFVDGRRITPSK